MPSRLNGNLHTFARFFVTGDHELLLFTTRDEWRAWLRANHDQAADAWLILDKKGAMLWLDGRQIQEHRFFSLYAALHIPPRQQHLVDGEHSPVEAAIAEGRMMEAGFAKITEARHNGHWEAGIKSEQTDQISADLEKALRRKRGALTSERSRPHSRKKQLRHSLFTARSEATRQRRSEAIVQEVAE